MSEEKPEPRAKSEASPARDISGGAYTALPLAGGEPRKRWIAAIAAIAIVAGIGLRLALHRPSPAAPAALPAGPITVLAAPVAPPVAPVVETAIVAPPALQDPEPPIASAQAADNDLPVGFSWSKATPAFPGKENVKELPAEIVADGVARVAERGGLLDGHRITLRGYNIEHTVELTTRREYMVVVHGRRVTYQAVMKGLYRFNPKTKYWTLDAHSECEAPLPVCDPGPLR